MARIVHASYSCNKTKEMHQFLKCIFGIKLHMFRTGFLSIIGSLVLYTEQQVYVIQVMLTACYNLYDIHQLLCIQYQTPDDGQKTCPKHVQFYSKNKFEKLVHLFGFIIRIYHDARSSECQMHASKESKYPKSPRCYDTRTFPVML